MTEKEVRDIVKSVLKVEMKKAAKEEADKFKKNTVTRDDVSDMIKTTLIKFHKWMWEKKGIWTNQI